MICVHWQKKGLLFTSLVLSSLLYACSSSSSTSDLSDTQGTTSTAGSSEEQTTSDTAGNSEEQGSTSTAGSSEETSTAGMEGTDAGNADSTAGTTGSSEQGNADSGMTTSGNPDMDNAVCTPSTRTLASGAKPYLGNIYRPETQSDERFHQLWNQVTPENSAKWNSVENTRNDMQWSQLDSASTFANNFNYPLKLHTLIASENQPSWLSDLDSSEQLTEITQWFDELAARYPDVAQIDVISEPVTAPPAYIDALGGTGETGWDWAISAFELARTRFPNSALLLNDFKINADESGSAQYQQLANLLKDRGLLDGVGIEGHFLETSDAATIKQRLDLIAELDVPVYLADLDLNFSDDTEQLDKMKEIFPAFYEHPAIHGLTFWGYRENQLWRSDAYLLGQNETDRPALDWLECYVGLEN